MRHKIKSFAPACFIFLRLCSALPSDAFQKYQSTSLKALYNLLQDCNRKLKKYRYE